MSRKWRKAGLSDSHTGRRHIESNTVVVAHGMYRHIEDLGGEGRGEGGDRALLPLLRQHSANDT